MKSSIWGKKNFLGRNVSEDLKEVRELTKQILGEKDLQTKFSKFKGLTLPDMIEDPWGGHWGRNVVHGGEESNRPDHARPVSTARTREFHFYSE